MIYTQNISDLVGCFADPPQHLSIKKPPEHPSIIQTRFFLYTRVDRQNPEPLQYGDNLRSIVHSRFNVTKHLKVLIHGFKGSGSDIGAILGVNLLLDIVIFNNLFLFWIITAKFLSYQQSLKKNFSHTGRRKRRRLRLDERSRHHLCSCGSK